MWFKNSGKRNERQLSYLSSHSCTRMQSMQKSFLLLEFLYWVFWRCQLFKDQNQSNSNANSVLEEDLESGNEQKFVQNSPEPQNQTVVDAGWFLKCGKTVKLCCFAVKLKWDRFNWKVKVLPTISCKHCGSSHSCGSWSPAALSRTRIQKKYQLSFLKVSNLASPASDMAVK